MVYKYKKAVEKRYGEHVCPYCKKVFHKSESLAGHIGGAHRRFITQSKRPHCKFCETELVEGGNWHKWAVKQRNLICTKCKRKQNRNSYRKKIMTKKKNQKIHKQRLAKLLAKKKAEKQNAN